MVKIWGYQRLKLLHDLADRKKPMLQLAQDYGVSMGAIQGYARRFASEIEEIQREQENVYAGLWIADKANRVAEYEAQVERFRKSEDPRLITRTQTALRNVAEELGHLPARLQIQHEIGHAGQPIPALLERLNDAEQENKAIEAGLGISEPQVIEAVQVDTSSPYMPPEPVPALVEIMAREDEWNGEADSSAEAQPAEE